ncbi:PIN domain-containing protein [Hyperthermus butylicus]|uniref:Nucleic acid binding, PIN domain n=1 Tax=Hyperthermus butylicus (strain DSM 5456 / JCM 9403 / PLM1-5) TaxID=415426 RepID=A2BKL7_HYPBU|nr:PIN domain-containing protein [Hyperthermus butylicus]ABM80528.1 nucleic acid binding, PIN domain [Hyperthermus butylicus DSM 5456]
MIYVDSNALVYLLHDVKPKSDLVSSYLVQVDRVYTSLRTVEEVSYVLIRIKAARHYGVRGIYQVREAVKKHGLEFVEEELAALRSLLEEYGILGYFQGMPLSL